MSNVHFHLPKPTSPQLQVGFGSDCCLLVKSDRGRSRVADRRRRREILEAFFSPSFSPAALPSAVDRLILWRSLHGHRSH